MSNMSNVSMVCAIAPVIDPGTSSKRTDFPASHYDFTRVSEGVAMQSKLRPEAEATLVFAANIACLSVATVAAAPASPEADKVLGIVKSIHPNHHQGKRR